MAHHLRHLDRELTRLVYRQIPERVLLIVMPPRHGKSELVSHWLPAWHMANWPHRQVLLASYGANFAATWGRKARDTFIEATSAFPVILPGRLHPTRSAIADWGTTAGGYMATDGRGGSFTGKGGHLLIADDIVKNDEEGQSQTIRENSWSWFTSTFFSRLEPDGVLVAIGTPWHRDDWIGQLRKWGEPVRVVHLPALAMGDDPLGREYGEALWPARFDAKALEAIRVAQTPYYWHALYQGRPTQHDKAEWPGDYFGDSMLYESHPINSACRVTICDPSKGKSDKSDFSAILTVDMTPDGTFWIDAQVERLDVTQIAARVVETVRERDPSACGFEENQFQELLGVEFLRLAQLEGLAINYYGLTNTTNKMVRIRSLTRYLSTGRIRIRNTPGGRLLLEQLRDFPLADYDDAPDALEMAIRLILQLIN